MNKITYLFSILVFSGVSLFGVFMFLFYLGILDKKPEDGNIEDVVFSVSIIASGIVWVFYQVKQSKGFKYLSYSMPFLTILLFSIFYTIRTYTGTWISIREILTLFIFSFITLFLMYLSFKNFKK